MAPRVRARGRRRSRLSSIACDVTRPPRDTLGGGRQSFPRVLRNFRVCIVESRRMVRTSRRRPLDTTFQCDLAMVIDDFHAGLDACPCPEIYRTRLLVHAYGLIAPFRRIGHKEHSLELSFEGLLYAEACDKLQLIAPLLSEHRSWNESFTLAIEASASESEDRRCSGYTATIRRRLLGCGCRRLLDEPRH